LKKKTRREPHTKKTHHKQAMNPSTLSVKCRRWKRKYMESEHTRRDYINRWENDIKDNAETVAECEDIITALKAELKHTKKVNSTQRKMIHQMQDTMTLHGIPIKRIMMSVSNCRAADDEICPLSLAPINKSPLPSLVDGRPCTHVLNPMKPEHKCAELACGHRFNSMWLMNHFVEHKTFRCPVCNVGLDAFHFQEKELPPGVVHMLKSVDETRKQSGSA
jgi:hypothetical protein